MRPHAEVLFIFVFCMDLKKIVNEEDSDVEVSRLQTGCQYVPSFPGGLEATLPTTLDSCTFSSLDSVASFSFTDPSRWSELSDRSVGVATRSPVSGSLQDSSPRGLKMPPIRLSPVEQEPTSQNEQTETSWHANSFASGRAPSYAVQRPPRAYPDPIRLPLPTRAGNGQNLINGQDSTFFLRDAPTAAGHHPDTREAPEPPVQQSVAKLSDTGISTLIDDGFSEKKTQFYRATNQEWHRSGSTLPVLPSPVGIRESSTTRKRRQKFDPAARLKVKAVRKLGSCLVCRMYKESVLLPS